MKYESCILKRLIDTYGVIGNPRYLSEIIKEFIVRGKELYPQLFTYQSDWLAHIDEFGLTPEYTVSYTGQHIYTPNTKEKPVKSAILKGQTLVNLVVNSNIEKTVGQSSVTEAKYDYIYQLENNKDYTIQFEISNFNATKPITCSFDSGWGGIDNITIDKNGIYKTKFTANRESTQVWFFWAIINWEDGNSATVKNIIVLEGDHTQEDSPYFEGMQSVKMPVLTTTGKNTIYQVKYETLAEDIQPDSLSNVGYGILDNSDSWTLSFPSSQWIRAYGYDSNGNYTENFAQFTEHQNNKFIIKPSNNLTKIIKFRFWTDEEPQLEKGTQATAYEPYKSNILTVNEDVTLRSNGDVYDELNLLTGQLTQRIGEDGVVLSQEVVKTVELTIHDKEHQKVERLTTFEGGTHFTTSSQDGSLLPTLTVDVVTDLEETLLVCSLEGNTM